MLMKKILLFSIIFISLLSFVNLAEAAEDLIKINNPLEADDFPTLINDISDNVSLLVGGIAVIMLIIAGIYFLTAAGSPEKIQTAKKFLTYAIIGIVIAIIAKVIVNLFLWILGAPTVS